MNDVIANRFGNSLDNELIRKVVTVRPEPVCSLVDLEPTIGAEMLSDAWKLIYLPNQFSLEFISEMVGRARLHFFELFSSEVSSRMKVYTPTEVEVTPICLTGLAGVGKSCLLSALRKVMPGPAGYYSDHFAGQISLVSYWYASAREKVSGKSLLSEFMFADVEPLSGNQRKFLEQARKRANRDGVSLIFLDETQYINTGLGVAKITDILLTLASIGPPAVYICNYSLVHKLFGRNSEDKQRLLSQPRIMLPDLLGSQDWTDYVEECVRVSGGAIRPGSADFAAELYRCTFGVKRLVVQLLKQAYIECRSDRRHWIELRDLSRAYRSAAYTSNASEVEELQLQALGGRRSKLRLDLKCPFELPAAYRSNIVEFVSAERQQHAIAKVFNSSLTESERSAKKLLDEVAEVVVKKPARRPAAKALSKDEEAKAFYDHLNLVTKQRPPKKPR
jgi:hypothetical protein